MTDPSDDKYRAALDRLAVVAQSSQVVPATADYCTSATAYAVLAAVDELRAIRRLLERIAGPEPERYDPPGMRQSSGPPAGVPPHILIARKHQEEDR